MGACATAFCRRYEVPELLASIRRPFVWDVPTELLLLSIKHMLGCTVLESSCSFTTSHIIINSPPPRNPWILWHTTVNDPQDGRYVVVPSLRINFANMGEEEPEFTTPSTASKFFASNEEEDDDIREDADYEEDEDDLEVDRLRVCLLRGQRHRDQRL
ncbi:hypothetical protein P691DRAFT_232308 [Macrolepiota fuliginosa MF-IS2]|uniref:Uncharacterized protein n=1 Tax=Macrolepiota fuliginosa MF-IS2 TaxID=1400762 RepID=A0A9P5WXR4_9AGAR|nr:hypothetical protein P691DRAFT_232308 [Macrolepiota fuliginosa MF-IS2]